MTPARATPLLGLLMLFAACPSTVARDDGGSAGGGSGTAGGAGGGSENGRFLSIDRTSGVPDGSVVPPDVTLAREFECDESDLGLDETIAETAGAPAERLTIRRTSTPCTFDLFYSAGGAATRLSPQPSGYLIAGATRFSDGVRLVCASEIAHHGTPTNRVTDGVGVRCWASVTTAFTASALVIAPNEDYAPWVRELVRHPTRPQAYVLRWARDFSFNFLNMSDRGRPATDGIYETVLVWNGTTLVAETPPTKVSSVTNLLTGVSPQPWAPTPEDVRDLGSYIDFRGLDAGP